MLVWLYVVDIGLAGVCEVGVWWCIGGVEERVWIFECVSDFSGDGLSFCVVCEKMVAKKMIF